MSTPVATACRRGGLDLVRPFAVHWYNDQIAPPGRLPSYDRHPCLGLLVGNSRALWPRFLDALRSDSALREREDPLDRYVETVVNDACAGLSTRWRCSWAHGSRWLAIQRLAQRAGLAYLSPGRLSVHPTFGPWIALRAVIVVDVDGPDGDAPALPAPCDQCPTQCEPAFTRAAGTLIEPVNQAAVTPHWRLWVAARDACPVGREHRYDELQIGYHYTKERAFLQRALAELS